jgi:cytochrome c oxidase subunit 2
MDEIFEPKLTIKAIGAQWYWIYEYSDFTSMENPDSIAFESFLIPESDLEFGDHRQLAVDNYLVLPIHTTIRLITTSIDVIHSFAVPSLGVKIDAMPGRLNTTGIFITRPSTYFGQCSELCGALHSAMPIGIKAVNLPDFISFIDSQLNE